jgi:prenyltransferase beta subunit
VGRRCARAIEFLLARGTLPILYWLKTDILEVPAEREYHNLEKYGARVRLLEVQGPDGGWSLRRSGPVSPPPPGSHFIETLRTCFRLYDFGCRLDEPAARRAADFIFSTQSRDGVFGSRNWAHTWPTGHALALEVLCRFGLDADRRVRRGFLRLAGSQRADGGWGPVSKAKGRDGASPRVKRAKTASSARATGMALRALAESPGWRSGREARRAGEWIVDRFLPAKLASPSCGPGRGDDIAYPFWTTSILSSLDSLSRVGFRANRENIRRCLEWLLRRQLPSGGWESRKGKTPEEEQLWATLAVLRVFKRFGLVTP